MRILFLTHRGDMFEIEGNSVREMQQKVARYTGIPISEQTLSYNGKILRSALDCVGIKNGSIINLDITAEYDRPWPQLLSVRILPAPLLNFNLEIPAIINQTVGRHKRKILERAADHTPCPWPVVVVVKNRDGIELPDHLTLMQCEVLRSKSPVLTVEFREEMELRYNITQLGEEDSITVGVNDAIEDVREWIQEELLEYHAVTSITSVLLKDERGVVLHDGTTVFQCQIRENSTLQVEFRVQMNVVANFPGMGIPPVAVRLFSPMDNIQRVKEHLIVTTAGIPIGQRMVVRQENRDELPDDKRLVNCDISLIVEVVPDPFQTP